MYLNGWLYGLGIPDIVRWRAILKGAINYVQDVIVFFVLFIINLHTTPFIQHEKMKG